MKNETIKLELRELNESTFRKVRDLEVHEKQKSYVASNVESMALANFCKYSWFRGIYVNDEPVGFVMLDLDIKKPEYYLGRFMIDKNHQRKGYGKIALDHIVKFIKEFTEAKELMTGVALGEESALNFYLNYGFEETEGTEEMEDDEKLLKLKII